MALKFLRCLAIAVAVVGLGVGSYLYFFVLAPVGSGPAGPSVPAELFREGWTQREVLLVGLGDSVTDGYGASPGFSYFERLLRNPVGDAEDMTGRTLSAVFPRLQATNLSVSGSTSIHCIEDQIPRLPTNSVAVFGLVVMTTGGNDIIHQYGQAPPREGAMYGATIEQAKPWIANYARRLDEIVKQIRDRFPGGCEIFLANIYDPTDETCDPGPTGLPPWRDGLDVLRAYNAVIAECATKYEFVHLVDIHGPFLGHGIHATKFWLPHYRIRDPHYWYHSNVEDPNDRGYDALRRLFLLEIAKVFSRAHDRPALEAQPGK